MLQIQSANVTIMVSDLDPAVKFYTETLGFTLKNRYGNHWADLEAPGITIGLHPTDKTITTADNLQLGLKVADLEQAISELEQKGITCKTNTDGGVKLAFFTDPDQNTLYLVQPKW